MDITQHIESLAQQLPQACSFRWTAQTDGIVHLDWLWVPVRKRGAGIGTQFLSTFLAGLDSIGLQTTLDADPTLRPGDPSLGDLVALYLRMGYRITGITPEFWVSMERPVHRPTSAAALLAEWQAAKAAVPSVQHITTWANSAMDGKANSPPRLR